MGDGSIFPLYLQLQTLDTHAPWASFRDWASREAPASGKKPPRGLPSSKVPDDENEFEEDASEALERRALVIEEAVRFLQEGGVEVFQKTLFDKLEFMGYPWQQANPILRADPHFRFMGMMVALKDLPQEEAS